MNCNRRDDGQGDSLNGCHDGQDHRVTHFAATVLAMASRDAVSAAPPPAKLDFS